MKLKEIEAIRNRYEGYSLFTDRDLESYCGTFNFDPEDLNGKTILDVGSGCCEMFAREAQVFGAEVYSLNPKLKNPYISGFKTSSFGSSC
jgi:predicted RNA methylase